MNPLRPGLQGVKQRRAPSSDERGAAAVEFAFVVPLILLLVFGVIEFGWALSAQVETAHAAREGARAAAIARDGSEAEPAARAAAPRFGNDLTANAQPSGSCSAGEELRVEVTVAPYESLTGLVDFLPMPTSLSTQGAMRCGG